MNVGPGLPPRFAHACSVLGGEVVVFGGLNPFGVTTSAQTPTALVWNISGKWNALNVEGPDIGARAYLTVEPNADTLYIFGGYKPDTMVCSNSLYCMFMKPTRPSSAGD